MPVLKLYKITVQVMSPINATITKIINCYLNLLNRKSKKILIYTDSRGLNCEKPWRIRNYKETYAHLLNKKFQVKLVIAPHTFTTLLDFVKFVENNNEQYEVIIAHIGVVDFAPRPYSSYLNMLSSKLDLMAELNVKTNGTRYDETYENEATISFADEEYINNIGTRLQKYDNLVFINSNLVDLKYRGNYWRERPKNINLQLKLEKDFLVYFNSALVDMNKAISDRQRELTVDNVHLNLSGHKLLYKLLTSVTILGVSKK